MMEQKSDQHRFTQKKNRKGKKRNDMNANKRKT